MLDPSRPGRVGSKRGLGAGEALSVKIEEDRAGAAAPLVERDDRPAGGVHTVFGWAPPSAGSAAVFRWTSRCGKGISIPLSLKR